MRKIPMLCRYDYVVLAVEALQHYTNCCAMSHDTLAMVRGARKHIERLEKIERELSVRDTGREIRRKVPSSVLEEFQRQFDVLVHLHAQSQDFLRDHREEFTVIKDIHKTILHIEGIHDYLTRTKRDMKAKVEKAFNNEGGLHDEEHFEGSGRFDTWGEDDDVRESG